MKASFMIIQLMRASGSIFRRVEFMRKRILTTVILLINFLSCDYGFHKMYDESVHTPAYSSYATVYPGSGSWLAADPSRLNSEVRVVFNDPVNTATLSITGSMNTVSVQWLTTSAENDTLVIKPAPNWPVMNGATMVINCETFKGGALNIPLTYNIANSVFYVKSGASGTLEGTRGNPMAVIQNGVNGASAIGGGVVLVAQGEFTHSDNATNLVNMANGVSMYGGYSASDWETREPQTYPTLLRDLRTDADGTNGSSTGNPYRIINYGSGIGTGTILDGFQIRIAPLNSGPSSPTACAIFINNSSPIIQNNYITSNDLNVGSGSNIIGIRLITGGSPDILNNTIELGRRTAPANSCNNFGIYISSATPNIQGNSIHAGESSGTTSDTYGIGIFTNGGGYITGNTLIHGGRASRNSYGILASGAGVSVVVENNGLITGADTGAGTVLGIQLASSAAATVRSNALSDFSGSIVVSGIHIASGSSAIISSNYINTGNAGSTFGLRINNDSSTATVDIFNNVIIAGNTGSSYGIWFLTTASDAKIVNNTINGGGGTNPAAVYLRAGSAAVNSTIEIVNNNLFTNLTAGNRFGIYVDSNFPLFPVRVDNNNIFNCSIVYSHYDSTRTDYTNVTNLNIASAFSNGCDPENNITDDIYSMLDPLYQYRITGSLSGHTFHTSGMDATGIIPSLTTDRDGVARGIPWSIGAYEY
jgi:hypothetical protein